MLNEAILGRLSCYNFIFVQANEILVSPYIQIKSQMNLSYMHVS
jgi:hypothetical protein